MIMMMWNLHSEVVTLCSVVAALACCLVVARIRHVGIAKRAARTLLPYTAIFLVLFFFSSSSHHLMMTAPFSFVHLLLAFATAYLHICVYLYHLAYGFSWLLHPRFCMLAGLPGYCFLVTVMSSLPFLLFAKASMLLLPSLAEYCCFAESEGLSLLLMVFAPACLIMFAIVHFQKRLFVEQIEDRNICINQSVCYSKMKRLSCGKESIAKQTKEESPQRKEDFQTSFTVCQVSDPHLGLFMSCHELRTLCLRITERKPSLVVLTGDFFASEVTRDKNAMEQLKYALEPLKQFKGRAFACPGNHDYEGLKLIQSALEALGITLLCDEKTTIQTEFGGIDIVGSHFVFPSRLKGQHLSRLAKKCFQESNNTEREKLRIMLIHDPAGFHHLPPNDKIIAFAGHVHGGQWGLTSFGCSWTLARALFGVPDHGLWAHGRNYLYVHRGTGQHAFPFRFGVYRENSLLHIQLANDDTAAATATATTT